MSELKDKLLWRRGDVRRYLGVSEQEITKLIDARVIKPIYLRDGGRAFFVGEKVMALAGDSADLKAS